MASKIPKKAQSVKHRGQLGLDPEKATISAAVWGQLEPLDRKAREMEAKWGDTLPSLVSPELAGRFRSAYEALGKYVECNLAVETHKVAGQLMKAWDVLEREAISRGHRPLPPDCYCMDLDGKIICIARNGAGEIRAAHPEWVVYTFEDAARILAGSFTNTFYNDVMATFPDAKVVKVVRENESYDAELDDEIPF